MDCHFIYLKKFRPKIPKKNTKFQKSQDSKLKSSDFSNGTIMKTKFVYLKNNNNPVICRESSSEKPD
jgi:hypothetical protein